MNRGLRKTFSGLTSKINAVSVQMFNVISCNSLIILGEGLGEVSVAMLWM